MVKDLLEKDWKRPRKRRLTARRLLELVQEEGYKGSYDSIQRFTKKWREEKGAVSRSIFIPLQFAPGDAYQFDWSHEDVLLNGIAQRVKVAHFRLSHSRHFFVAAYPRESSEMVFDAHNRAFAFFGGTCKRGIYDNMSTAVTKVLHGKERIFNHRFVQLCSHYLIEPVACTPGAGWEKGQVEKQVKNVREWMFTPRPRFKDIEELNSWLLEQCIASSKKRKHPVDKDRTIWEVFQEEQTTLIPTPSPFDGYSEKECRVSQTGLIGYDRNHYSVDCKLSGKTATVRASATRIQVVKDGVIMADHARIFDRDKTIYDPWHYLDALEFKPGALRDGAPFKDWKLPAALLKLQKRLLSRPRGDKEFVDILNAARTHGIDITERACRQALADKTIRSEVVLNIIARELDPPPVDPVSTPEHLSLKEEPVANCNRYNSLLQGVSHATH
jgi:transposase